MDGKTHTLLTAQKIKFPINDIFSKCDQIRSLLRTWSHLLKKFLMENLIFCAVSHMMRFVNFIPVWTTASDEAYFIRVLFF